MLRAAVCQLFRAWLMVQGDLFALDEFPDEEESEGDVFVPDENIAFPATLSAPVRSLLIGTELKSVNPSSVVKLDR